MHLMEYNIIKDKYYKAMKSLCYLTKEELIEVCYNALNNNYNEDKVKEIKESIESD